MSPSPCRAASLPSKTSIPVLCVVEPTAIDLPPVPQYHASLTLVRPPVRAEYVNHRLVIVMVYNEYPLCMMGKSRGRLIGVAAFITGIYFLLFSQFGVQKTMWMKPETFQDAASGVMEDILYFSRKLTGSNSDSFPSELQFLRKCDVNVSQNERSEQNPGSATIDPFFDRNCTITPRFTHVRLNLTIVTAYWNLGTFQKGSGNLHFSTNTYFRWASTFKYLVNPLVVYTDSEEFKVLMETLRADNLRNTKIFLTNRTVFWPFQLTEKIKSVFDQPSYPKYLPNTVKPEYSAAQHSKFAVVADTVRKKVFNTPYYAWLDIGYFRDVFDRKDYFKLDIPPGFNSQQVSFNKINNQPMNTDPFTIFRNNIVWVGGGMFLARGEVILQFEQLYHNAVLHFLDKKLMNSDQQVIFSLYSNQGREALKPKVELQLYIPTGNGNSWFYLGYLCRKKVSVGNS